MKISPLQNILIDKYGQFLNRVRIFEDNNHIELSILVLHSKAKEKGLGTKIMNDIIKYSDTNSKPITLTPTDEFGSDLNRLTDFYKKFGFKDNDDKSFDDEMIRQPLNESKSCSCGCNSCGDKKIKLNESLYNSKITLSEGLNYLITNNISLIENIYRYGSKSYLNVIKEARHLYSRNILDISKDDEWILKETNLGEYDYYKGKLVPLDLIFEDNIPGGLSDNLSLKDIAKKHSLDIDKLKQEIKKGIKVELEHTNDKNIAFEIAKDHLYEDPFYYEKLKTIEENKNPRLNSPKRSSGPKKYYVYTKNPKTGKVIKVNFGDSGNLSAKINNPKARQGFAKRHDCKNKKDRTKPGYWSCRLPRYAKSLGLKGGGNFFW